MNTLHLDLGTDWRGGQAQALLLLEGLRARGHGAELVTPEGSALAVRAAAEGVGVHTFTPRFRRAGAARLLHHLLARVRYDVIHAHDGHGLTAAWMVQAQRRAALIASRRVLYPLGRGLISQARYRAAARVIAISNCVAEILRQSGMAAEKLAVVPDGVPIPPEVTSEARQKARAQWGVPGDEPLLGCVGVLLPDKNQELLIRALPAIGARHAGARLALAGDGPMRAKLGQLARTLKVEQSVTFAGFVTDLSGFFNALDAFLFPALGEGLGSSLLLAMSYGIPVIALARGGIPEIVVNGRNGLLLDEATPEAFAAAALRLLGGHELTARFGNAARETVQKKFSADRMVEGTLAVYEETARS